MGEAERTAALKPVSNVSWDRTRNEFFCQTSREYAETAAKQIKIFGLTMEITARALEDALAAHGYPVMDVQIKGSRRNWAEAEMRTKSQVEELLKQYGTEANDSIRIGNHVLRCVKGDNPQERLCFQCRKPGHFKNQCPDLQPNAAPAQSIARLEGRGTGEPSAADTITVSNSEVAMIMVKNMVAQMVDDRASRMEEKLDQSLKSLTERVNATEVHQQQVAQRINALADSFQQNVTAAGQAAVQATMTQAMQQWQHQSSSDQQDFHQGLPSRQ